MDKPRTEVVGRDKIVEELGVEVIHDATSTNLQRSDPFGESNIKGVFVAGDAGAVLKQVAPATIIGVAVAVGISFRLWFGGR